MVHAVTCKMCGLDGLRALEKVREMHYTCDPDNAWRLK